MVVYRLGIFTELLILTAASTLIYTKSIFNGNTMDDHPAIEWNIIVLGRKPDFLQAVLTTDFWGQELNTSSSHGSFRPLVTAMYRFQAIISAIFIKGDSTIETPPHPGLLHAVNIFFHWLSTITFYWLLKDYVAPTSFCSFGLPFSNSRDVEMTLSFAASLLFAVHPIHTEAVCGGVGQAEVTCTFLMFLATVFYYKSIAMTSDKSIIDHCLLGSAVLALAILAAASKEQGFMLLPMCCLIELSLLGSTQFRLVRVFFCLGGSLILAGIRLRLFGPPRTELFLVFDNPASFQPFPIRQLTYAYLPIFCLRQTIFPAWLCADWGDGAIELVKSFADIRVFLTILITNCIIIKTWQAIKPLVIDIYHQLRQSFNEKEKMKKSDRLYLIALAIIIATFLPSSNIFSAVGFVVAERVLYAPSAGICLMIAVGFHRLSNYCAKVQNSRNFRTLFAFFLGFTCLTFSVRTMVRTFDWESDMTLSRAGLRITETNARIFINVGAYIRETTSDCDRALAYFDKSVVLSPLMAKSHFNRARCMRYLIEKRYPEVDLIVNKKQRPPPPVKNSNDDKWQPTLRHLARACDFSLRHCIAVVKHNIPPNGFVPNHVVECHLDLVNLMTQLGELYLGELAQTQAVADQATELCDIAQRMRPDFPRVYIAKANLLMSMQKFSEAKKELIKARNLDMKNPEVLRALAWILAEKENRDADSVHLYHEALEINPNFDIAATEFAKIVLRSKLDDYYALALYRMSQLKDTSKTTKETASIIHQLKLLVLKK